MSQSVELFKRLSCGELTRESMISWCIPLGIIQEMIMSQDFVYNQNINAFDVKSGGSVRFSYGSSKADINVNKIIQIIDTAHKNNVTHVIFRSLSEVVQVDVICSKFYFMNEYPAKEIITEMTRFPHPQIKTYSVSHDE